MKIIGVKLQFRAFAEGTVVHVITRACNKMDSRCLFPTVCIGLMLTRLGCVSVCVCVCVHARQGGRFLASNESLRWASLYIAHEHGHQRFWIHIHESKRRRASVTVKPLLAHLSLTSHQSRIAGFLASETRGTTDANCK